MRNIHFKAGSCRERKIRQSETFDSKVAHRMPFPEFFSSLLENSRGFVGGTTESP